MVATMASSYFTLPSFARAKKNQEELEKTNPQDPVLKDEDEKFLEKQISKDDAAPQLEDSAIAITDDGEAKDVSKEEAGGDAIVPETQPEAREESDAPDPDDQDPSLLGESKDGAGDGSYDDAMKNKAAEAKEKRKAKKDEGMELPSQEEAEAATRGFHAQGAEQEEKSAGEKRTWASYLPTSVRPGSRKAGDSNTSDQTSADATKTDDDASQRTWASYAASYVPSLPTRKSRKEDPDAKPKPIYNEDGTIDEKATAEQQEREVSVLLDNLNLSSINNRVFPLTQETQKLYSRFAQCLKDIINGAPTAYEDMDKLMKEAGPKLEEQWKQMPPFVQTLVKSLPAKMGGVVGPEMLAAVASEKPGEDLKRRMAAASSSSGGGESEGLNMPDVEVGEGEKKSKRRIPGMKSLIGEKSAVAGMLRSVVTFLQTRFPLLASTTNVVMSLAVFSESIIILCFEALLT